MSYKRQYNNRQLKKAREMIGEYIEVSDITLVQINEWLNSGGSILNVAMRDTIRDYIESDKFN